MNERRLIEIIHRPGVTGGREQAALTAEVCGGELARLAEPIRRGEWPPIPMVDIPQLRKLTLRILNAVFKDPLYGPQSAAELATQAGWHSSAQKIREGRWDPDRQPKSTGDGAGVDQNDGRLNPPPKFLRKPRFDSAKARQRAETLSRERKSNRRPRAQEERWNPHVEKRRVHTPA